MKNFTHSDIFFQWQDNAQLLMGNRSFQRLIDWSSGMPRTVSMQIEGREIAERNENVDLRIAGFPQPETPNIKTDYIVQDQQFSLLENPDGDGARFTVFVHEDGRDLHLEVSYIIYPELPVMGVEFKLKSQVIPLVYWHERQRTKTFTSRNGNMTIVDSLTLPDFKVTRSIELQMRTDYFDEPLLFHEYDGKSEIYGNILLAENASGSEFFFLQEAGPSMERRGGEPGDFFCQDKLVCSFGSGITPGDIIPGKTVCSNRIVCGCAKNGDAANLIKKYLRLRQGSAAGNYGIITVNPWGCGKFPQLVNEQFLKDEIRASGSVNADVYQIDDGYQHGGLADMALHNRVLDRHFWSTRNDLLPEGFVPLHKTARESGVKLSLWFAPSANRAYCDWQESADILLDHWKNNDFDSFKIDGVIFSSYDAEENFGKLLNTLYKKSDGKISVNLDVTNGTRGGLLKFAEFGLIFLENRYCCSQWAICPYHPGNTLRNIWDISQYCRIQNLQIEIPNPGNLLPECYTERNIPQPTEYDFEYWAMIPFFASPLLWMAPTQLDETNRKTLAKLMSLQKEYRSNWRDAIIDPIGSRPDGKSITGFCSDNGFLLVFREINAPESAVLDLGPFKEAKIIYASSEVTLDSSGKITFASPGSAALIRLV